MILKRWGIPMSEQQNPDFRFDQLLKASLVSKGYRPRTDADIEQMLDVTDVKAVSDEKLKRMLRKVNGEEPMLAQNTMSMPQGGAHELTTTERELVALHRAQGKELPPELAAKLRAMEERARRSADEEADAGE